MRFHDHPRALTPLQERLWRVIFLSETRAARRYDLVLLGLIGLSVLLVALETVSELAEGFRMAFYLTELALTVVFTVEYGVRLWVCRRPLRYATSFFGVIDLLSILPAYLELLIPGGHLLVTLRVVRFLRMFRILKMTEYMAEAQVILDAIRDMHRKIFVFMVAVLAVVCVEGTAMYVIESGANPDFDSIPQSIYWAIVTLTTVGYGDVAPITLGGKMMASLIMLTGFGILAVPTGIVSAEFTRRRLSTPERRACAGCGHAEHDGDARFCARCGRRLPGE